MSCGEPHETPCHEVLDAVYVYLDGEQDAVSRQRIRVHLDECAPCLRQYGLEQAVKSLVARCCGSDPAPADLRTRVLLRIQQVRSDIDHLEYRAD